LPPVADRPVFVPQHLNVLTVREGEIEEMAAFITPDVFPRFGLPDSIPARATGRANAALRSIPLKEPWRSTAH